MMLAINVLCEWHALSCKLLTNFSTFLIFISLGKMANNYKVQVIFHDTEYQL